MKKMLMMAAVCLMVAMTFAAQCTATTKKGTQCKRQASPGSLYCWQHCGTTKFNGASGANNAAPMQTSRAPRTECAGAIATQIADSRCQAATKKGAQCKRKAQAGSKYCFQHAAMAGNEDPEKTTAPSRAGTKASDVAISGGRCAATTKDGSACKRKAKPGSKFCWQHE